MRRFVGLAAVMAIALTGVVAEADPNRPLPGLAERKLDRPQAQGGVLA